MLLVLTTVVSLEAIYLAIFIQMTVNRHTESLREVEADVDEIQEDIGEIQEDVDEIQEDVDELQEDLEEMSEDEKEEERKKLQAVTLEALTADIRRVLTDLEEIKKRS
jgi:chromosome segregation ATPase